MSLDPIKIPQNVYIEDRIVGPLTLRQVIVVALGGGFSYGLWAMLNKVYGGLPLPVMIAVWIPAVLSFAFAFVRINDLSLLRILLLLIEQMEKPKLRTWAPRQGIVINFRTFTNPNEGKAPVAQKSTAPIEQITAALDATPVTAAAPRAEPVLAETSDDAGNWRRPVNPERVRAEPLKGNPGLDGLGLPAGQAGTPRSSLFRDLSPAA